ncbi:unnamed protein product, partial [Musa acuminata var. zebrina]
FGLSDTRHVASPTLPARCCQCPCRQFGCIQLRPCTNGCRNYEPCQESIFQDIFYVSRLE